MSESTTPAKHNTLLLLTDCSLYSPTVLQGLVELAKSGHIGRLA